SELPAAGVAALQASLILAVGSSLSGPLLFLAGLPLTVFAFAVACRAMWLSDVDRPQSWGRSTWFWLSAMAALGIVAPSGHGAAWYETLRLAYSVCGVLVVGVVASGDPRWR